MPLRHGARQYCGRSLGNGNSQWSELDPSDAGYAQRMSLSGMYHDNNLGGGQFLASGYVINNRLTLWNDFTHYLVDPINGDQEQQHENRIAVGGDSSYAWKTQFFGASTEWLTGVHARVDFNDVSRVPTEHRIPLTAAQLAAVDYPSSLSESDYIHLYSLAAYAQMTSHWSGESRLRASTLPCLPCVIGVRHERDQYHRSLLSTHQLGPGSYFSHNSLIFKGILTVEE
jgi:hypothetical protein